MGVRKATPGDATAIADAHISGWQVAYRGILPDELLDGMDRVRRATWWKRHIGEASTHTLVATLDDLVIGFADFGPSRDSSEDWAELYAIYVHPDHWGAGHGRELILATELATLAFGKAHLWVLDKNSRARAWYERQGWTLGEETLHDEIGGVPVTEVRYNRTLRAG